MNMRDLWKEEFSRIRDAGFSEVDGFILRDGAWTEESLQEWREVWAGNSAKIEALINHVHVARLFWQSGEDLDARDVIVAGKLIQQSWAETLRDQHPDKNIVVEFDESLPDDGWLGDLQVTAYVEEDR